MACHIDKGEIQGTGFGGRLGGEDLQLGYLPPWLEGPAASQEMPARLGAFTLFFRQGFSLNLEYVDLAKVMVSQWVARVSIPAALALQTHPQHHTFMWELGSAVRSSSFKETSLPPEPVLCVSLRLGD